MLLLCVAWRERCERSSPPRAPTSEAVLQNRASNPLLRGELIVLARSSPTQTARQQQILRPPSVSSSDPRRSSSIPAV